MTHVSLATLVAIAIGLMVPGGGNTVSTTPSWTFESDQAGAHVGHLVTTAGDVNGDGFGDILTSAPFLDNGEADEGRAWLFPGSAAGPSTTPDFIAESNQAGAAFGRGGTAGDVNGDGYADLFIGAPALDDPEINEGQALIFNGSM